MPIMIDFSQAGDGNQGDYGVLPEGDYNTVIYEIKTKTSQAGNPMLEFTFQIPEGEPNAGRRFWANYSLLPNAVWKLKQTLVGLGYSAEKLAGQFDLDPEELKGTPAIVTITKGQWNGKETNNVEAVRGGSGASAPATAGAGASGGRLPF